MKFLPVTKREDFDLFAVIFSGKSALRTSKFIGQFNDISSFV
ncbi:hypothetical protein NC99_10740 [Sunxiuqinia dokdonensis]|uniref:Uncharacterized protein n=1 Tax=Sunxiuqinia dokdonensis TaxID=1409788 RepID=A0A0L8VCA5_9BACT|nr:hypothetical protein NC99_10740 [Sunxiuqinia dokdonensis]